LADLRQAQDLSMEQLAARCTPPTTASQINKLEKGKVKLSLEWIYRLAEALQVHPVELLEELPPRLGEREAALVELYRGMSENDRDTVFRVAESIGSKGN
jgi:transcriptional regulator with XRE-family HTH domain